MSYPDLNKQRQKDACLIRRDTWIKETTAVLVVDVQNSEITSEVESLHPEYFSQLRNVAVPNQKKIIDMARQHSIEVIYTVIESLTTDGRDRSLDHKLSEIHVAKGSELAEVIKDVKPINDEIVLRKTSSGVFNSTTIEYVLRNIGIDTIIVVGFLTDQCVDMAIRDGADRGFYMICVSDACATWTKERHHNALQAFGGYCEAMDTDEIIDKIIGARDEVILSETN